MINVLCWGQDWEVFDGDLNTQMQPFAMLNQDAAVTWCPQRHVVGVHVFEGAARHAAPLIERKVRTDGKLEGHAKVFVLHTQSMGKLCQALYMAVAIEDWQRLSAWESSQSQHCLLLPLFQAAWSARGAHDFVIVQGPSELLALGLVDNRLVHASAVVFSSSPQDGAAAYDALARRLAQEVGNRRARNRAAGTATVAHALSAVWLPWRVHATPQELTLAVAEFARTSGMRCELAYRAFVTAPPSIQSDASPEPLTLPSESLARAEEGLQTEAVPRALSQPEQHPGESGLAEGPSEALISSAPFPSLTQFETLAVMTPSAVLTESSKRHEPDAQDFSTSELHTHEKPICSAFAQSSALAIAKNAANSAASKAQFLVDCHALSLFVAAMLCAIGLSIGSGYRFWQAARTDTIAAELSDGALNIAPEGTKATKPAGAAASAPFPGPAELSGGTGSQALDAVGLERAANRDLLFLQMLARSEGDLDIVELLSATREASAGAGVRILGVRFDGVKLGEAAQTRRLANADALANTMRSPASPDAGNAPNAAVATEGTPSAILDGQFAADSNNDSRAAAEFYRRMKRRGYLVSPLDLKGAAASLSESSRLFSYRISRSKEAP